jgi:hypothetical protein
MDFSKYDPLKKKLQSNAVIESEKRGGSSISGTDHPDPEAGFTAADYDNHSSAPGMTCGLDIQQNGPVVHPPWMSSAPVILLIEYLHKYPNQGVILYERFGMPGLKFKPGIKGDDIKNGRAQIAMNMFRLLQDASSDLKAMISQGIEIPLLIRLTPKERKVK